MTVSQPTIPGTVQAPTAEEAWALVNQVSRVYADLDRYTDWAVAVARLRIWLNGETNAPEEIIAKIEAGPAVATGTMRQHVALYAALNRVPSGQELCRLAPDCGTDGPQRDQAFGHALGYLYTVAEKEADDE